MLPAFFCLVFVLFASLMPNARGKVFFVHYLRIFYLYCFYHYFFPMYSTFYKMEHAAIFFSSVVVYIVEWREYLSQEPLQCGANNWTSP